MKNFLTFFTILAMTAIGYYATGYIIAQGTTRDRAATDHTGRYAKDGISSESIDTTSPHRLDTPTSGQHRRERIIELENGNIAVTAKILELLKIPLFDHSGKFRTDQLEQLGFTPAQAQHIATLDSRAALDRALSQTDTASRDAALEGIATSVGKEGISPLLELTANLPPEARGVLFSRALPILIESDPQDISTHLPEILRDNHLSPETIKAAYSQLATHLAGQRQHDTRAWLDTVPSEYQSDAMKGIATRMAQRDLRSLATFLDTMPKDTRWETGVKILITDLENIDPKMHTHWQTALREAGYE